MNQLPLHPALFHLTQQEIDDLVAQYFAGVSANLLITRFKISMSSNQIRKILPPKVLNRHCSLCGAVMIQDIPARRAKKIMEEGAIKCSSCGHDENQDCQCGQCVTERNAKIVEEESRQWKALYNAIVATQKDLIVGCSLEEISLADATAYSTAIRPPIPRPFGHPFHEHPATDSTVIRPPRSGSSAR